MLNQITNSELAKLRMEALSEEKDTTNIPIFNPLHNINDINYALDLTDKFKAIKVNKE